MRTYVRVCCVRVNAEQSTAAAAKARRTMYETCLPCPCCLSAPSLCPPPAVRQLSDVALELRLGQESQDLPVRLEIHDHVRLGGRLVDLEIQDLLRGELVCGVGVWVGSRLYMCVCVCASALCIACSMQHAILVTSMILRKKNGHVCVCVCV